MLDFYAASPLIDDPDPSQLAFGAHTGCSGSSVVDVGVAADGTYALQQVGEDSLGQPLAPGCVSCRALRHIRQTGSPPACFHQGSNAIELPCSR